MMRVDPKAIPDMMPTLFQCLSPNNNSGTPVRRFTMIKKYLAALYSPMSFGSKGSSLLPVKGLAVGFRRISFFDWS